MTEQRSAIHDNGEARGPALFPPAEPTASGWLEVDSIHTVYWEESGNAQGIPIVILHGGPGAAADSSIRQLYDPDFYRIIYFHQRGTGRSKPLAETRNNTIWHLISDMESLRALLGVQRWVVTGGSWGSTLALAYAQHHPGRCLALLLWGVFLGRRRDIQWFLGAAEDFFPEAREALVNFLPPGERGNLLQAYARRLSSRDRKTREAAARSWADYEASIASLVPNAQVKQMFADPGLALSYAVLNAHYFLQNCFLDERPILDHMEAMAQIPGYAVHGRYDLCTAYRAAVELVRRWPQGQLITVDNAGHSRLSPPLANAIVRASEATKALPPGRF